jgi:hypothetical protein
MNRGLRVEICVLRRGLMLLLAVLGLACALWAADPFVGTWKVDLAKSKTSYPLDVPLEGSFTTKVEAQDNGIKAVEDLAWANGTAVQRRWTAKYDGKDYPVEGDPRMDAISLKKANPNTIDYVVKKSGKQFASGKWVVSKDGKTSTNTGSAQVDKGPTYTYDIFLEKK